VRILAAGIGNIFLGDDAFGVEVAQRLMRLEWPEGVHIRDFGIRGYDLAQALLENYDAVLLLDAVPRGGAPGTLYTIQIDIDAIEGADLQETSYDAHALHPLRVLQMVKAMGGRPKRVLLLGCEPERLGEEDQFDGRMGLSEPVAAAIDDAVRMARSRIDSIAKEACTVEPRRSREAATLS
jgi:hydrogenase maturation protease